MAKLIVFKLKKCSGNYFLPRNERDPTPCVPSPTFRMFDFGLQYTLCLKRYPLPSSDQLSSIDSALIYFGIKKGHYSGIEMNEIIKHVHM